MPIVDHQLAWEPTANFQSSSIIISSISANSSSYHESLLMSTSSPVWSNFSPDYYFHLNRSLDSLPTASIISTIFTTATINTTTTSLPTHDETSSQLHELIQLRNTVRFWVQHILVPCVTVIGLLGNLLTVLVMCQRRMRTSSTHIYLAALALFDALYLVFTFLLSFKHYPSVRVQLTAIKLLYWNSYALLIFGCDFASNTSIWLTVCFTIERYIVIRYPIKGKVLCTRSRALKMILSVALLCFLITFPTFFEWTTVRTSTLVQSHSSSSTDEIMETYSALGQNPVYRSIYNGMSVFGFVLVPLSILTVFNLFLIRSVRKSSQRRRHWMKESIINNHYYKQRHKKLDPGPNLVSKSDNNNNNPCKMSLSSTVTLPKPNAAPSVEPYSQYRVLLRQDAHITRLLIAVVIFFLVTQLPPATVLLYNACQPETDQLPVVPSNHSTNSTLATLPRNLPSKSQLIQQTLGNVFNLLVAINAAGNFILYYLLSQKYRRTLADIGWSVGARLFYYRRTTDSRSIMSSGRSSNNRTSNNRTSNKSKSINNIQNQNCPNNKEPNIRKESNSKSLMFIDQNSVC